ncbi:4563_t:CDS:2, partial [Entrophospora sp. SA101]
QCQNLISHVGFQYLKGMHLNDSTLELGSNRDRHRNIGEETPLAHDKTFSDWKKEIKEIEFLYRLVGKKSLIGPSISSSLSNNNYTTENDSSKIQKPNTNTNKIANKKEKESRNFTFFPK